MSEVEWNYSMSLRGDVSSISKDNMASKYADTIETHEIVHSIYQELKETHGR
jgi:hypothetical protein